MRDCRFHVPSLPAPGECCALPADEARHAARVLRLREGAAVVLLDGRGGRGRARVQRVARCGREETVECVGLDREQLGPPPLRVHLLVAPPRSKTMGLIVRMATELGVWRIAPVLCQFGVARPAAENCGDAWRGEALAAAKQSGNVYLPQVEAPRTFAVAVERERAPGYFGAVPASNARGALPLAVVVGDVVLWIGPEGGFAAAEEDALATKGFMPLCLGDWVLRVETAVPVLIGFLLGKAGDDHGCDSCS